LAKIQNIKEAARTLIFLQENGIGTYEELVKKEAVVSSDYHKMGERFTPARVGGLGAKPPKSGVGYIPTPCLQLQ
jgi:hypothetical protein